MARKPKSNSQSLENPARRRIAKSGLLGGGFVGIASTKDHWIKPIVGSAVLPAHAKQTIPTCPEAPECAPPPEVCT